MNGRCLKACINKWRKMGSGAVPFSACEYCYHWGIWPSTNKRSSIPKDVPKGHLAVYVGENCTRFVIKISLLDHPMFKALLDHAQDGYDFITPSRLWIPCDESIFLDVVRCASSPRNCGIL